MKMAAKCQSGEFWSALDKGSCKKQAWREDSGKGTIMFYNNDDSNA